MKKFTEKEVLWIGGVTVVAILAYALYTHANAQATVNSTPALTTAPNTVVGSSINLGNTQVAMPVFAPVSAPTGLNYQVQQMPANFATLSYQLPTIPNMPAYTYTSNIGGPTYNPPQDTIQQILDPFQLFS